MNRDQMIHALTKYELEFLIDNPEHKESVAEFFALGGYNAWGDKEIEDKYLENVWLEGEQA